MHIPSTPQGVWKSLSDLTLIDRTEAAINNSRQALVYCAVWRMIMAGRIERITPCLKVFRDLRPGNCGFVLCHRIKIPPEMVSVPPERLVAREVSRVQR